MILIVLDKRVSLGGYNMGQDYNFTTKNLSNKRKLHNSRSSGKISKKSSIKNQFYKDKFGNRVDKRFSTTTNTSKNRTKSFKRIKENEFRKLLRHVPGNAECLNSNGIRNQKYTIDHLIDSSDISSLFKTHENIMFPKEFKENTSRSDTKTASKKINRIFLQDYSPNDSVLKEQNLNSVKCNLWTKEDLSYDDRTDYSDPNEINPNLNSL
jgi:hypothetical protein